MEIVAPATVPPEGSVIVPMIEPELPIDCAAQMLEIAMLKSAQLRAHRNSINFSLDFKTLAGINIPMKSTPLRRWKEGLVCMRRKSRFQRPMEVLLDLFASRPETQGALTRTAEQP